MGANSSAEQAAASLAASLTGASSAQRYVPPPALAAALAPAVHCSVSVPVGPEGLMCSSGNLLSSEAGHSALFPAACSLAGITRQQGRPKLLQLRPHHHRRRHALEDVALVAAECQLSTIVCLPVVVPRRTAAAGSSRQQQQQQDPPVLGTLTVGFAQSADVSAPALKQALLVAYAMALRQERPLQEFSSVVASMLLPQRLSTRAGAAGGGRGGSEAGSESDMSLADWDYSSLSEGGEEEGRPSTSGRLATGAGAAQRPAAAAAGSGLQAHPLTLQFRSRTYELQFASYHATHLQRVDGLAYLICLCFFCLEVVLPAPFRSGVQQRSRWWCVAPSLALLPGLLLLLSKRTRDWFSQHRDWMLFLTWIVVTGWMLALRHRRVLAPGDALGCLTVLGMAMQMRFRFLAPFLLAVNTQVLPSLGTHALLHAVVLPLACCYCFEAHMRHLFMQSWRPS